MHEFALAENIITTVCEKITGDLTNVSEINIEVGVFAGVVTESLEFGLKLILNPVFYLKAVMLFSQKTLKMFWQL